MAITTQKLLPGSTFSNNPETKVTKNKLSPELKIYRKVVKIDKLLKNSFVLKQKEQSQKIKERESNRREKKEKDLETPKFKGFQILKNALPKTGFLDAIKRFIIFTFAGWLFTNLFKFLPKLLEIAKFITPIYSWFEKGVGILFEGIVSFIDFGYKAYDAVRSFAKQIGGEKFADQFDKFSSALNTFLNLTLIAGMAVAGSGGLGKGAGKGLGKGFGRKPGVTTSGGRPLGRPDVRNPFRDKPRVTTSGGRTAGKPDIRNPLRSRPKVTTSRGNNLGGRFARKGIGKFASKGVPFIGPLIDFGVRALIFKEPLGKAAAGAVGAGAGQALGGLLGGSIGAIAGSVVPFAGTALGAGAGSIVGQLAGGFLGDWIGTSLYDLLELNSNSATKKMKGGGKVSSSEAKESKEKRRKRRKRKDLYQKIQPGKDVGGEKEIEKIFPNPDRKFFGITLPSFEGFSWTRLLFGGGNKEDTEKKKNKSKDKVPNAISALTNVADSLGKSGDWIGSLMRAGVQVSLGEMPDSRGIARSIAQVIGSASDPAVTGIRALSRELFGFAEGGAVSSSILSPTDTLSLERTLESNLRSRFELGLQVVRKESRKRGPTGRDEMLEENIQRGQGLDVESGKTVTGGNSDFWTLVAIASREDGDPQGWADVAQSIYNRVASGIYGAKTIKGIVTRDGQYQPTWQYPKPGRSGKPNKEWFNITDAESASRATGRSVADMNSVAAALRNRKYQEEAAKFVGGRTDFMGGSNQPGPGDVRRKENAPNNFFGWFVGPAAKAYGSKNPGPARVPQLGNITVMEGGVPSGVPGDLNVKMGKGYGAGGQKIAGDLGDYMKANKSKIPVTGDIHRHPRHPPWAKSGHSPGSLHYQGRAIDLGGWAPSNPNSGGRDEQAPIIKALIEWNKRNGYQPVQLIHHSPKYKGVGSYQADHNDHVHVAYKGGGLIQPQKPNVPIPDSFASYASPDGSTTLAVLPVYIKQQTNTSSSNKMFIPSSTPGMPKNMGLSTLMR